MKLKYQMRGLGIGIIVTALLMGVALDDGRPLSDAEIRALASELGMVESDSLKLTDIQNTPTVNPTEQPDGEQDKDASPSAGENKEAGEEGDKSQESNGENQAGDATAEPAGTEEPVSTNEPEVTATPEPTAAPQITEAPVAGPDEEGYVEIVIYPGENSYGVSIRLTQLGLVQDALEFDTYLIDYGYSRSINVGTYRIKVGTSEEEIAKIITKTN